jgi:hypothetical protein
MVRLGSFLTKLKTKMLSPMELIESLYRESAGAEDGFAQAWLQLIKFQTSNDIFNKAGYCLV